MRWLVLLLVFLPIYFFRLLGTQSATKKIPQGAQIRLTGRISQQPYLKESKQIVRVNDFSVVTGRFPEYFYGQRVEVIGKLNRKVINSFKTEFVFNYPHIRVIEEGNTLINQTKIVGWLWGIRTKVEKHFSALLPEPQASLLSGILLGSKRQIPQEFLKNLRVTGTIHVVVASGYNVTVIGGFLVSLLAGLMTRKLALALAFLGILAYTLMAGAQPPIVRAAIMGSLTYLAQFLGREKEALISLIAAAAIMLLISPLMPFDIGFQLSFLATAGILLVGPRLNGRLFRWPGVGENLRTTLAAQIGVLPILLANFGQMSFLSPIINALILPVVPLIMGLGAITAGLGLIWQPIAQIFAWFALVPLTYFVKLVEYFSRLTWVSFSLEKISFCWAAGYYILLVLWWLKKRKFSSSA